MPSEQFLNLYQILVNQDGTRSELPSTGVGFGIGISGSTILGARESSFTGFRANSFARMPYGTTSVDNPLSPDYYIRTDGGQNNSVLGGQCNILAGVGNPSNNVLLGGQNNCIVSGCSNIVGGVNNYSLLPIGGGYAIKGGNVIFGLGNRIAGALNTILGGCGNVLAATGYGGWNVGINNNSILGGQYNCTFAPNPWDLNSIIGSIFNTDAYKFKPFYLGGVFSSTIVGGLQNKIGGSYNIIGAGFGHKLVGDQSSIVGGRDNQSNADCSSIAGGSMNLMGGRYNFIGVGDCNVIGYEGPYSNWIQDDVEVTLGSKFKFLENQKNSFNSILNGKSNIIRLGFFNSIFNGRNNYISGERNIIFGGTRNQILGATDTYISHGSGHSMAGCNNSILQGTCNKIGLSSDVSSPGDISPIWNNTIHSSILNGNKNTIYGSRYALILNGICNTIQNNSDNTFILGNCATVLAGHTGAAILADGRLIAKNSMGVNTLLLDFENGVYINTSSGLNINGITNFDQKFVINKNIDQRISGLFV